MNMVYDMYDYPARIQCLLDRLTAFWIDIGQRQLALIPAYEGGYVSAFYGIWAPKHVVCPQEDASSSLSPNLFRQYLLSGEKKIARSFPYTVVHIHSPSIWAVEQLLSIANISAIEINYDDNGPRLPELLPWLRRIQEEKPLVIRGAFTPEDIDLIKRHLSPQGLLLSIVSRSVEEARSLMSVLRGE
jgi:hypothetical protein